MNVHALVCCRCGGPLTRPEALPALIDCLYCGTVNAVTREATSSPREAVSWDVRKKAIGEFTEALVVALKEKRPPFDALRACSAAHLGIAGKADTVARIVLAIASDFEREERVSVVRDPLVLSRIAQGYLLALDELRTSDSFELNLPFLAVNERGPAHLGRKLTAKLLAELAARDPMGTSPPAAAPAPRGGASSPAAPVEKKKGWWPFS
jgi:hypothetical protein